MNDEYRDQERQREQTQEKNWKDQEQRFCIWIWFFKLDENCFWTFKSGPGTLQHLEKHFDWSWQQYNPWPWCGIKPRFHSTRTSLRGSILFLRMLWNCQRKIFAMILESPAQQHFLGKLQKMNLEVPKMKVHHIRKVPRLRKRPEQPDRWSVGESAAGKWSDVWSVERNEDGQKKKVFNLFSKFETSLSGSAKRSKLIRWNHNQL